MPKLVEGAARVVQDAGHHDPLWLIVYVVAINAALAVLRFLWVWVSLRLTLFRASRSSGAQAKRPSWHSTFLDVGTKSKAAQSMDRRDQVRRCEQAVMGALWRY